jgi:hypothetical protein
VNFPFHGEITKLKGMQIFMAVVNNYMYIPFYEASNHSYYYQRNFWSFKVLLWFGQSLLNFWGVRNAKLTCSKIIWSTKPQNNNYRKIKLF